MRALNSSYGIIALWLKNRTKFTSKDKGELAVTH